jgi:AcrR family transcriptional regulator
MPHPINDNKGAAAMTSQQQGKGRKCQLPRGPHHLTPEQVASDQRSRLIEAMVELVGEQGYATTTVGHVIARTAVSRKTFYTHFDDRRDLLLATFDTVAPAVFEQLADAVEVKGDPTRQLEALMRRLCRISAETPCGLAHRRGEAAHETQRHLMPDTWRMLTGCLEQYAPSDTAISVTPLR